MHIEPTIHHLDHPVEGGWIEVVCGSMFSGKTEELIRRLTRAKIARQSVQIFKPAIDTRYDDQKVVSHNQNEIDSIAVQKATDILTILEEMKCQVIGIDEAQFFDKELVKVCQILANQGKRIVVAGLDMDFEGKPFGIMPQLLAVAEYVTKVHAICMCCGKVAAYSFRLTPSKQKILLGEKTEYEARCRTCFVKGNLNQETDCKEVLKNEVL